MGCCDSCGQVILVLINLLFSAIGILLLAFACVVRFGSDLLDEYLRDAYNEFEKALKAADAADDVAISNLNIGDLISDATIAFIVIGAFFFCLGIAGCIGACCQSKCLLIVYAITLGVIFIVEVVFVVLLVTIESTVDGWVKKPLITKLEDDYTGTKGKDAFTLLMNFVMSEFDCCGIDNYTEFEQARSWNRTYMVSNQTEPKNLTVPLICCKNHSDTNCGESPDANNSYIETPCYSALKDWATDRTPILIGVGAGVAAVQLILIIFSLVVCCHARRAKDDESTGFGDGMPIHQYDEPKRTGHSNMMYQQESPPTHRSGYEYDRTSRMQPSAPYQDYPARPYDKAEPYRGRTDYYTGPPDGYRSGGYRR